MTCEQRVIWKDIPSYEGLYQASNLGEIRSLKRGLVLSPSTHRGYKKVNLFKNGKYTTFSVHRLILITFTDESIWKPEVNHKDYDRSNNRLDNLEWVTRGENVRYSVCNRPAHFCKKHFKPHKRFNRIVQMTKCGDFIREWNSLSEIYRELGFEQTPIKNCCDRKPHCKTAYGYKWKYL